MALKHQDVVITGVIFLWIFLDCVYKRVSDIAVRGCFSVCTTAEKCVLNPHNYIANGKKKKKISACSIALVTYGIFSAVIDFTGV